VPLFAVAAGDPNAAASSSSPFLGLRPRDIGPARGVIEHVITGGDRLDLLARHYYNDERLWWRILDANPGLLYAGDLALSSAEGMVLLIPRVEG
jgi:nucleoid-associated protein YgaU